MSDQTNHVFEEETLSSQPELSTSQSPEPPPRFLSGLGWGAMLIAPFFVLVNMVVVFLSIQKIHKFGAGPISSNLLWINIATVAALGGVLFLAGIGLKYHQAWGRKLAIWYFVITFFCCGFTLSNTLLSQVVAAAELAEADSGSMFGAAQEEYFGVMAPFSTLYAVILLIFMLQPATRAWSKKTALPAQGESPAKFSKLAMFSMILAIGCALSFIPFLVATALLSIISLVDPAASEILWIIAGIIVILYLTALFITLWMAFSGLKKTSGSKRTAKGEPMAWAAVIITTILLSGITGSVLSIGTTSLMAPPDRIIEGMKIYFNIQR